MKYTLFFIALLSFFLAQSQSATYLDENRWVTKKENAKYIQTTEKNELGFVQKEKLFVSGQLLSETTYKTRKLKIKHGQFKSYFKNGNISEEGQYADDSKTGIWKEFYEDSQQKDTYRMEAEKRIYHQYWDESGNAILSGGQGTISLINEVKNEILITVFKDSLMYTIYSINLATNDTIYNLATKSAEFKNGYSEFYMNVAKNMRYPAEARRNGIMGKVYVQFIVNEKGELEDVKSIKGIGGGCDEEAEKAIRNSSGKWIPAEFENKKVKSRMILPISFRLG